MKKRRKRLLHEQLNEIFCHVAEPTQINQHGQKESLCLHHFLIVSLGSPWLFLLRWTFFSVCSRCLSAKLKQATQFTSRVKTCRFPKIAFICFWCTSNPHVVPSVEKIHPKWEPASLSSHDTRTGRQGIVYEHIRIRIYFTSSSPHIATKSK